MSNTAEINEIVNDEPEALEDEVNEQSEKLSDVPAESEDESEVIVSIGEESPPSEEEKIPAPEWVRELRKNHRELQKRNRELEAQVNAVSAAEKKVDPLPQKPTLESCDYDADDFERKLEAWQDHKRSIAEQEKSKKAEEESEQKEWNDSLSAYNELKVRLKAKDFEDAEDVVTDTFSNVQQGIIVRAAKNSAVMVYALGKNPEKAKEYASIKDPVKFAAAIGGLEKELKVTNRKSAPPPERTIKGSAPSSGAVDSQLERLREKAVKSSDWTDYFAYKRNQKN